MAATDNDQATEQVNVRLSKKLLDALDAEAERRTKDEPGMTYTRTDIIRTMLAKGVAAAKAAR